MGKIVKFHKMISHLRTDNKYSASLDGRNQVDQVAKKKKNHIILHMIAPASKLLTTYDESLKIYKLKENISFK